jgi:hypothetical protein
MEGCLLCLFYGANNYNKNIVLSYPTEESGRHSSQREGIFLLGRK